MAITVQTPGKLIISGEHAVVYGKPALAMAVDRYAVADVTPADADVHFSLPDLNADYTFTRAELIELRDSRLAAYRDFLEGRRDIKEVLPNSVDVIPLSFALGAADKIKDLLPCELSMTINIPIGCGMGSSASVGLAAGKAAALWAGTDPDMFELSLTCERCMHGHPSGVDSYVCLNGGVVRYIKDSPPKPRPPLGIRFALIHTGTPECTTGECVVKVKEDFGESAIWDEFERITNAIDEADSRDVLPFIRENHGLLCRLGVVPQRVQELIADIEMLGGAAKVCGAGAIRGDNGGIVMVLGGMDLDRLCAEYDVKAFACEPDSGGLR